MDSEDNFPFSGLTPFSKKFYEKVLASPQFLQNAFYKTLVDMGINTESLNTSKIPHEELTVCENANYDIKCDAKYLKRNAKGETSLHTAARKKDLHSIINILRNNVNPNTQDNAGWTPLHEAVFDDNYEITLELLSAGAIVNVPGFDFTTPLHIATRHNNLPMVKLLLKFGADPSARDINGRYPEYFATNAEIVSLLKEYSNNADIIEMSKLFQKKAASRHFVIYIANENMISCEIQSHLESELKFQFSKNLDKEVTHVIVKHCDSNVCDPIYEIMKAILLGCVLVNQNWLFACDITNKVMNFEDYELNGTIKYPTQNGPRKARNHFLNLHPPLFTGCYIYLNKMRDISLIKELVVTSGAKLLNREPNPEHSPDTYFLYHCPKGHLMENTSTLILYEDGFKEPTLKYNMKHIKTLPLSWFFDCIQTYEIREPF